MVILEKQIAGLSDDTLSRFVSRTRRAAGLRGRVNVLITSSAAMRSLNLRFRGLNKATDVLSFPTEPSILRDRSSNGFAGEVAISADIALQNALRRGHSGALEVKVLILHGILHLAGFDHERDNGEMARKEAKLRRILRLPIGLTERAQPGEKPFGKNANRTTPLRGARRTA
jgi:probable rRNA maturation factor